jgi:hypothetical protein
LHALLNLLDPVDLPAPWGDAFKHIRDSIGRIDETLADNIDELVSMGADQC